MIECQVLVPFVPFQMKPCFPTWYPGKVFFRVTLTMAMTSDTDNDTDGIHGNKNCYRGNIGAEKNMTT